MGSNNSSIHTYYHTGHQFSAIFIQVKNLSSSSSDAVAMLTNELKIFATEVLQGGSGSSGDSDSDSGVPLVTMVLLVGSGEKDEEELHGAYTASNIHVVLRGLTPCQ